jgi:hypothetical protein
MNNSAKRGGQTEPAADGSHQQQRGHGTFQEQRGAEDLVAGIFAEQQDVDLVAADETGGQPGKDGAELPRADVKHLHEDDGRAGDIDQQAGEGERPGERIGEELRLFEHQRVVMKNGAQP